jgi:hypothetical protein
MTARNLRLCVALAGTLAASGCGFSASRSDADWAQADAAARATGERLHALALRTTGGVVVTAVYLPYLDDPKNAALRAALVRDRIAIGDAGGAFRWGPASRTLARCDDGFGRLRDDCRYLPVARVTSFAFVHYYDDYQGFETRERSRGYVYRFTAEPLDARARALERAAGLHCVFPYGGTARPWSRRSDCIGSFALTDVPGEGESTSASFSGIDMYRKHFR